MHRDVTSQLSVDVHLPTGTRRMPMPAVRGFANDGDPAIRRAGYDAELVGWPQVAVPRAGGDQRDQGRGDDRQSASPVERIQLEASLFANAVSRPTFDAMQAAVTDALGDFRRWMGAKAALHGGDTGAGLKWSDLVAPCPAVPGELTWDEGVAIVRDAFTDYSPQLGSLVTRALDEQ